MKLSELKVGQTVLHRSGFIAEVEKFKEFYHNPSDGDVHLKVINVGTSSLRMGSSYIALPSYLTLLNDVKLSNKMRIDVEVEGLEKLKELAEEMSELAEESSVFECTFSDMTFKGTKSDFEAFLEGMYSMINLGNLLK